MGWSFTHGATRASLVAERNQPWEYQGKRGETLEHSLRGNVLWSIRRVTNLETGTSETYICCDLFEQQGGEWGYKPMDESAHPFYYSCPVSYLKKAPVRCQAWRDEVLNRHADESAKKSKPLTVGETVVLVGVSIPQAVIVSLSPLVGNYNGVNYKLTRKMLAV